MIYPSVNDCIGNTPLVRLKRLFRDHEVFAKLEFLNPGGSVKDRPASFIINQGLQEGIINQQTHLIESSSGNLGIAIAMVAKNYDLKFTCVVDPKISPTNLKILKILGANIDIVHEIDDQGGYLKSRIQRVKDLVENTPHAFWINQYANPNNWKAHYFSTGNEIVEHLDKPIDYLILATSTSGTILGISRRLREEFPNLRVIAVDAVGSILFGGPSGPREIPGIGASRVPELLNTSEIDEVIYVDDWESVQGCHNLVAYEGIFAGGSSGSVIAAIEKLLPRLPHSCRVLTLFPDRGDRYLNMVYDEEWVAKFCHQKQQFPLPLPKLSKIPELQSI